MSGSSQYRFGVLAKIVKHMRTRHQDGDDHPLSIEDILDETNQLDIGSSVKAVSDAISIQTCRTKSYNIYRSGFNPKPYRTIPRLTSHHAVHDSLSSQSTKSRMEKVCCVF